MLDRLSHYHVRNATVDDADTIASIYLEGWRTAFGHLLDESKISDDEVLSKGRAQVSRDLCLVIVKRGKIKGFASGDRETGQLSKLYVAPTSQGKGAGGRLLVVMQNLLSSKGAEPWALTWEGNLRAIEFYRRHGWNTDGMFEVKEVGGVPFGYIKLTWLPAKKRRFHRN